MRLRFAWVLPLIWACATTHTTAPTFELPEATDRVEAKTPWAILMAATASSDPGIRGHALNALIRHAPQEQATSFMTVALFDPQPWVTAHCVEGIATRDPSFVRSDAWTQKLEASRKDPMLLSRMLSAAAPHGVTPNAWIYEALVDQPAGGGRAPLSRAAWEAGVEGAADMYCSDLGSGDLPMDTAWLLQIAQDHLPCIDEALASGSVGAESEVYDTLSIVQVQRGTRAANKVLREHLVGTTERQLERLDIWIASGALSERTTRSVTPSDPTVATALRLAVAEGRALRSTLRDALDWTDPDLVELALGLAQRATEGENPGNQKAAVAILERGVRSPRSMTRVAAIRALAEFQNDHPLLLAAIQDTSENVRLEAAVALWRANPDTGEIAKPTDP